MESRWILRPKDLQCKSIIKFVSRNEHHLTEVFILEQLKYIRMSPLKTIHTFSLPLATAQVYKRNEISRFSPF